MKLHVPTPFLSALMLLFTAGVAYSQNPVNQPVIDDFSPEGTCGNNYTLHTNPNAPQNGNGSLGQIYNFSKCGLNYVRASQRLKKRGSNGWGVNQPAPYVISGIPTCRTIERAYMWSSMSGTSMAFNVTIVNPLGQTFTYPAVTIGTGPDKCWGYGGTSSYRLDVTSCISGNGTYTVSGFPTNPPTPQKDTDGATLFIIYSDPTANYQGHMIIHDGCLVGIGGNTQQTLTGINACANSIYARAFCMTGDWQLNGISGVWNGSNIAIPWNWWNYDEVATTVTNGQATATYSHAGLNDCYNWVVMGLYYRTNTCTACPLPSSLTLNPTSLPATCSLCNGTATVNPSGGSPPYTISWSTNPVQTTATATGLCAGNYTVTVSDNSCLTSTAVITITSAGGVMTLSQNVTNVTCNNACNGSVSLTVGNATPPVQYLWNTVPAQTTQTATGLCAGTYSVIVTDANGCTITGSYTVTQPPALTLTSSGFPAMCNNSCTGQAICIPGGGTGPYTYLWMPGNGTNASMNNLCAGTYTVTVTDANGCTITNTVTVTQPTALAATTSADTSHCGLPDGQACVNASGGTGPYTYLWTPGNQTGSCATNLTAGNYCCTITDANGCTMTTCVSVPSAAGVVATTTAFTNVDCFNACNGTATVTPTGGIGPYTYSWNTVPAQNTATATGLCAGNYIATITDASGCVDTANVTITQPTQLSFTSGSPTTLCIGQCTTLTATPSGGTAPYNVTWSPGGPNVCPTVTTTYTVTVTDANGCTVSPQTVLITVNPPLNVSASVNPAAICIGNSYTLSAMGGGGSGSGYTYTWTPGNQTGPSVTVTPTTTGTTTYTVTLTDNCGTPQATATTTIVVNPGPTVAFASTDSSGCAPLCVDFSDLTTGGNSWSWTFNGGSPASSTSAPTGTICFNTPGSYGVTLTVVDVNGCVGTTTVNNMINVYPNPVAGFTPSADSVTVLNPEICFTDNSINANTYFWDFGDPQDQNNNSTSANPCHTYNDTGIYCVKQVVTTNNGCVDSTLYCVYIIPEFTLFVPNAFTPNGDLTNDFFFPKGTGVDESRFEMWIFDRWGNLIWNTARWGDQWDGKANGGKKLAQEDVYVWKIVVYDFTGKKHAFIGHVTLVR